MFNKEFWVDALVRAVKTGAQAAIALLGTNAVGVLHWDWLGLASVVAGAMVMSVLSSLVSLDPVGKSTGEADPAVTEPEDDPEDVDDSDVTPVEGDDAESYVDAAPEEATSDEAATAATESVKQFY